MLTLLSFYEEVMVAKKFVSALRGGSVTARTECGVMIVSGGGRSLIEGSRTIGRGTLVSAKARKMR